MNEPNGLPRPPQIDEGLLNACRQSGDYCPVLFRWYLFVGELNTFLVRIRPDSADVNEFPPLHYAVLIGLLNRCSRLMLANVALSHEGLFGETTAIIDRCIFESVVKLQWLCTRRDAPSFRRLILEGLKSDVEFKNLIRRNVAARDGEMLTIEARMLESIDAFLATASATEQEVAASPRLPDLASMIEQVGAGRLEYVVGQRLGSHHVHGTWPSLWRDYLEEHDGRLGPRDHDCRTHQNQYVFVMLMVLNAARSFIEYVARPSGGQEALLALIDSVRMEVLKLNAEVVGEDFENVKQV